MTPQNWTTVFLLLWVLLAIGYDIWAIWMWGSAASISYVMMNWAQDYPVLALVIGLVLGHCLWRVK